MILKQRVTWIDLCKGFAIILVLLGHSYSTNNRLLMWINSFHMPLFFILSGILIGLRKIYERPIKRIFLDNFQSLLIPYFIYSILLTCFIQFLKTRGGAGFISGVIDSLKYVFILYGNSPMWFLACLFLAELFLVFLHRLPNTIRYGLALLGFVIGVWLPHDPLLTDLLCRVLRAVFFLTIGELLSSVNLEKYKLLSIPMLVVHIFLSQWKGSVVKFEDSGIIYIICALMGSVSVILFFSGFVKKRNPKWLNYFGKNTLTILCTHPFLVEIIRLVDYKLLRSSISSLGLFEGIVITVMILLIEVPIIWVVTKYMPILAGRKRVVQK